MCINNLLPQCILSACRISDPSTCFNRCEGPRVEVRCLFLWRGVTGAEVQWLFMCMRRISAKQLRQCQKSVMLLQYCVYCELFEREYSCTYNLHCKQTAQQINDTCIVRQRYILKYSSNNKGYWAWKVQLP